MPVPPPPPPPPPPPVATSTNPAKQTQKSNGNRALLLSEIHRGTKLKKAVTNDRSAPSVGGKIVGKEEANIPKAPSVAAVRNKPVQPKPTTVNESLGALFAGGLPRKPSDIKSQKSISSTSTVGTTNASLSNEEGTKKTTAPSIESKNSSLGSIKSTPNFPQSAPTLGELKKKNAFQSSSSSSLPPPLPTKLVKQNSATTYLGGQTQVKIATSQQPQFQTLRPVKKQPQTEESPSLRRSESNEEIQKRPVNVQMATMRRPGAPPPPPPPALKSVVPNSTVPTNTVETPFIAPPPPPRISSYLESMEQRFHFVPISELPPPPRFIGFYKDYGNDKKVKS